MSLRVRRFAVVSVAALAVLAGGSATMAAASTQSAPAVSYPEPDGSGGYPRGHERPLRFGPFEFPRSGNVSGGFAWGLRD
jgi:hypothetical protein